MDTTVNQLLLKKGSKVFSVEQTETMHQCALKLKQHGVGSLLVMNDEQLVGILYERDISRVVVVEGMDPEVALVSEVMCKEFISIGRDTMVSEAMQIVNDMRVRHLPIIEEGKVYGLISIGDLNNCMLDAQKDDINHLVNYIGGGTPVSFVS